MIATGAAKKLVGGALTTLAAARAVASHAAWYVRYQVDGTTRESERRSRSSD